MQKLNVTTRLTGLALAVATAACAPHAAQAQATSAEPATAAAPAASAKPASPAKPSQATPFEATAEPLSDQSRKVRERLTEQLTDKARREADLDRAASDLVRVHTDIAKFKDFNFSPTFFRAQSADTPVIVSTEALDASAQSQLREDLVVMDKLIRDEVARAGADEPSAMGIKLIVTGRSAPQYVEGAGAIFTSTAAFPLAPVGANGGKAGDRPRDPASKWDQAKRDLNGYGQPRRVGKGEPPEQVVFDPAKLDQLKASLIKVLPEATNFRHLKENESVFITVSGVDDGGTPVRLTLKAGKADIDATAAGKLSPEDFAKRVALRIG